MAGFSLTLRLAHLILVFLVNVATIVALADQDVITYTIRGYVPDFLNGATPIVKTLNITKTPNPYSERVAFWDIGFSPHNIGGGNSTGAILWVSITPTKVLGCSRGYGNIILQQIVANGALDSRNQVHRLAVLSSGTEVATGAVYLFRSDHFLEVYIDVSIEYGT